MKRSVWSRAPGTSYGRIKIKDDLVNLNLVCDVSKQLSDPKSIVFSDSYNSTVGL